MPNGFREIPTPTYERDEKRLVEYYKKAFLEIVQLLKTAGNGIDRVQAESLLRQIEFILRQLDEKVAEWCEETLEKAFRDGQVSAIVTLGEAKTLAEAASVAAFTMLARGTVEALINDTYTDLLAATQNTERKVKALVRNVVAETMRLYALQQQGRVTISREIVNRLSAAGLSRRAEEAWVGIVDKAGRRWDLSTYVQMVVRTKLNQAWIEGARTEAIQRDVDLAVISSHGATDACRHFEGMVISLFGKTKGYRTYDELRATGLIFHPNCRHKVYLLRDFDLLNDRQKQIHLNKMTESEQALERWRERQQR